MTGWGHTNHNLAIKAKVNSTNGEALGQVSRSAREDLDTNTLGKLPGFQALFKLPELLLPNRGPRSVTVEIYVNGQLSRIEKLESVSTGYSLISDFIHSLWNSNQISLEVAASILRGPLQQHNQELHSASREHVVAYSTAPSGKRFHLSIVIPLYGNIGLLEHQLATFQRFRAIHPNIEFVVVWVIDDPRLVIQVEHTVRLLNEHVFNLCVTVIAKLANTGFASACNIGSRQHQSEFVMFWNSDLYTDDPNSINSLIEALQANPTLSAVSPVLCDPDGTVQTTWLTHLPHPTFPNFKILEPLHRGMTLGDLKDSDLSDHSSTDLLLPGAALMVRSNIFHEVGSFPTRYGIGDFEDGELSYRLRAISQIAVVRTPFFHLVGHSFKRTRLIETFSRASLFEEISQQMRKDSAAT